MATATLPGFQQHLGSYIQFKILHDITFHNTFHSTLSVFPQAITLLPHIYNTKSMCVCIIKLKIPFGVTRTVEQHLPYLLMDRYCIPTLDVNNHGSTQLTLWDNMWLFSSRNQICFMLCLLDMLLLGVAILVSWQPYNTGVMTTLQYWCHDNPTILTSWQPFNTAVLSSLQ